MEDDFALTLHGYGSMRKQGNGLSPRLGRNGPSPRKGGQSPSKGGASAAVRFWNDVLESQVDNSFDDSTEIPRGNSRENSHENSPKDLSSEVRNESSSPAARPSLQPLLELLDDVHFSDSEEMMEDEYLVVQPYELDSAEEMEIAPGKDDIQLEVEGEYTYGDLSDGSVSCVSSQTSQSNCSPRSSFLSHMSDRARMRSRSIGCCASCSGSNRALKCF